MKQTSNAIKFLLAQYRSIFKNAYFKGLATAVVVTAGLAAGAGQAQADTAPWYSNDSGTTWNKHPGANDAPDGKWTTKIAGAVAVDEKTGTISSGGNITIGDSGADIPEGASKPQSKIVTKTVYGGYSVFGDTVGNVATASNNKVFLISGGQVSGSGSNLVGGWAKHTGSGLAIASGNSATIISEGSGSVVVDGQTLGAWASSRHGATATNNTVNISTKAGAATQQTITGGIYGAQVWADDGSFGGIYSATSNATHLSNINFSGSESVPMIVGANVYANGATNNTLADRMEATNNSLSLTNVNVQAPSTASSTMIVGNMVNASSANADVDSLIVRGDSSTPSVLLSGGSLTKTEVFGGNITGRGDAQALNNTVSITDTTTLSNSAVYGASLSLGDKTVSLTDAITATATGNSVSIGTSADTKRVNLTETSLIGTRADLLFHTNASGTAAAAASTVTISGNGVIVGSNTTLTLTDNAAVDDSSQPLPDLGGNVIGAFVNSNQVLGTLSITSNTVTFDGTITGNGIDPADTTQVTPSGGSAVDKGSFANGLIVGARATGLGATNLTLNSNAVTVNGTVRDGLVVGAYDETGLDAVATATGNSVTVSTSSQITNSDIYAVRNNTGRISALNNDVTIQGKVTDSSIYGGMGADSVVSLEAGSNYSVSRSGTESINSDVVNLAGQIEIGNGANLSVRGFLTNGQINATPANQTYNSNITTVASSAAIYNRGDFDLYGKTTVENGATLAALRPNANIKVDGSTNLNTTVDDGDIFTDFVADGEGGQLIISNDTLKSYLRADGTITVNETEVEDFAGSVDVTSGGVLEFTDATTVLSDYEFATATEGSTAGKITVDEDLDLSQNEGSIFRGDEITVAHKLTTNVTSAEGDYTKLDALDTTAGIQIEANTLNLGSAGLSSTQSSNITFGKAIAKEQINFIAQTTGDDRDDATNEANGNKNSGYILMSEVVGSNFMKTNDLQSELEYYTALKGDINGRVTISGSATDQGKLNIADGLWTAHDDITVQASGSILVGGDTLADPIESNPTNQPDATLTLAQGLTLDVANSGEARVTAEGEQNGQWTDSDSDGRYVALDLRAGLSMVGGGANGTDLNGKAIVEAKSGGFVLMSASDVNDILVQSRKNDTETAISDSGAHFVAANGGTLLAEGDIEAIFNDFSTDKHGFNLQAGNDRWDSGILQANSITITNPDSNTSVSEDGYTFKELNVGGTIRAADITISDLQTTNGTKPSGASGYASQVTLANGHVWVSNSFTTNNYKFIVGKEGDGNWADLYFNGNSATSEGTINAANIEVVNGAIDVVNGNWLATNTNFALTGAGSYMTVGDNRNDTQFVAEKLSLATDTKLLVEATGTATFDQIDFSGLDAATAAADGNSLTSSGGVLVRGSLYINGDPAATIASGDSTVDDPANGVKFGDANSIIIDNNGDLYFDNDALAAIIDETANFTSGDKAAQQATVDTAMNGKGYTQVQNLGGTLHLGFSDNVVFGGDAIKYLKTKLFTSNSLNDGVLINGGILNIGDASFNGVKVDTLTGEGLSGYTASWESLKGFSDIFGNDVANNELVQTNVKNIGASDRIQGHWGSLSMASDVADNAQVIIGGDTSLNFAQGNNGYFISNASHSAAMGAIVQSQKSLTLVNGGSVGKITLINGESVERNNTSLTIDRSEQADSLTTIASINGMVNGNVASTNNTVVNVLSNTNVTGDITDIGVVNVSNGSTLNVANAEVIDDLSIENAHMVVSGTLTLNDWGSVEGGSLQAKDIVYEQGDSDIEFLVANNGSVTTETFTVKDTAQDLLISVGVDTDWDNTLPEDYIGTGYLEVSNYLELNGATLVTDPNYDEATAVSAIAHFRNGKDSDFAGANNAGILNGELWVGANAATGIGASVAETKAAIASFQEGGVLKADKYGSILYLNGHLTVANGSEIALNSSADMTSEQDIRDSLLYTISSNELDQYADLGLGANTAILMTEKAFENENGEKTNTAIYFDRKAAVVNSNGGDIVLSGTFNASEKLNFFNDQDNNGVDVKGTIEVYTQNGFLHSTLSGDNQGYQVEMHVDMDKAYSVMSQASNPVVASLIEYHEGRLSTSTGNGSDSGSNSGSGSDTGSSESLPMTDIESALASNDTNTRSGANVGIGGGDTTTPPTDGSTGGTEGGNGSEGTNPPANTTTRVTGNSVFLNDVVNNSHGAPAEAVARMALYGGAVQAAIAANTSSYEAIAARTGVGATDMGLTVANNGMGAALWLAPMYKNQDSDSFDAEGLSYGVDMDLYGVALGADFEFMPGLTAGIMFNVGSGSADGQGNAAASSVSNDFDYYGISVYGNYKYDALSITADLGYTAVDSDIDAHTGLESYGSVSTSVDSTAWTLGVTGKYTFNVGGVELAPHAGLRYSSIDLDDYSVSDIASYDADTMDIFSIPVGVTIAKEFSGEAWTVKPSLDLSVQGNFGDDTSDGTVHWTGVDGLATNVSSEMMDNFTYGATLGVSAQTGSFSMGLGVNYTGSDNVDEFGVNANARFVF